MTLSLFSFDDEISAEPRKEDLVPGAFVLRGFALPDEAAHLEAVRQVTARAPFRHMVTPGGFRMSVAMANCGALGWVTDTYWADIASTSPSVKRVSADQLP